MEVDRNEINTIKNSLVLTSMGSQDYPNPFPIPRYILNEDTLQLEVIPPSQYDYKSSGQVNIDPFQKNIVLVSKCKKTNRDLEGNLNCVEHDILFVDISKHTIQRVLTTYKKYAIGFDKNNAYIIVGRGSGKDQIIDKGTYMFKLVIQ
jgi:hypothetical protein